MKIIDGKRYYSKNEVAQVVGRSPQTVNLWDKWSSELEAEGKERLIPAPIRLSNNYRYWSEDDIPKIKEFADNIKYGDLAEFSKRQWGNQDNAN